MQTVAEALKQGLEFHRRGQLDQAEKLYRQVLKTDAENAAAWHLLGMLAFARGSASAAIDAVTRAINLDARQPGFHSDLAEVYRSLGRLNEAEASCRQALALADDFALAHNTLGLILGQRGCLDEAAACFRRALAIDPAFALPRANLASALHLLGQLDEALAECRQALARDPTLSQAYQELGRILVKQGRTAEAIEFHREALGRNPKLAGVACNLGVLLQNDARPAEAAECFRSALAIEPSFADAHCHLGVALFELDQADEAFACYRRALECNPRFAEAHYNLGVLLQGRRQYAEATQCYENAVRCKPDFAMAYNNLGMTHAASGALVKATECYSKALEFLPNSTEALNNLGNALQAQDRIDEARVCYQQTLRIKPLHAQARCNLALLRMAAGDLAGGWPDYEFRRKCREYQHRPIAQPQWNGEPLAGRKLLVHAEQGLGDTLQFVRFLPSAAERGGTILFEVPRGLIPLMRQSGFGEAAGLVAAEDSPGEFDLYLPLLSLPGVFGTTEGNIPAAGGYLSADPKLVEHWRGVLGQRKSARVGIAWQGSPAYQGDRYRSIPLAEFAPLAVDGVELISLQKGPGAEQLALAPFHVRDLGPDFDASHGAFMDSAAVIKNLDLVITSDTAIAHLAGGLGVDVWVALTLVPDWRWMRDRDNSPWYTSMRLFRQTQLGDWPGVFGQMAEALRQFIAAD